MKSQADREKIILAVGNIDHVAQVDDQMTVATPEPQSKFYTVKSGDSLSKISKEFYGDANQYNKIFEANRPLLKMLMIFIESGFTYSPIDRVSKQKLLFVCSIKQ